MSAGASRRCSHRIGSLTESIPVKWLKQILFALLILVILFFAIAALLVDPMAETAIEDQFQAAGLRVESRKLDVGLLKPRVSLERFVVHNKAEYGGGPLIEFGAFDAEYDRKQARNGSLRFKSLHIDIQTIVLVRNQKNEWNLPSLPKLAQLHRQGKTSLISDQIIPFPKIGGKSFDGADRIEFSLGQIKIVDLSTDGKSTTIDVGIKKLFIEKVATPKDLLQKIIPALETNRVLEQIAESVLAITGR